MSFSPRLHQSGDVYKFSLLFITRTLKSETSLSSVILSSPFLSLQVYSVHFNCYKNYHFSTHDLNIEKLISVTHHKCTYIVFNKLKCTLKHLKRSHMFRSYNHPQGAYFVPLLKLQFKTLSDLLHYQ